MGRAGELAALILLWLKGYRLRSRNWKGPSGELDLVVERHGQIVFVEVKTRSSPHFGGAVGAVDRSKTRSMTHTACCYLGRHGLWDQSCRFDVVAVERVPRPPFWRITHIADAIRPDLGRRM